MLTETNQSLLGWEVSQPPPYAQKKSTRCHHDSPGAARSEFEIRYFDFNKRKYRLIELLSG